MGYDWDTFGGNFPSVLPKWDIFGTLLGYPWGMRDKYCLPQQLPQLLGYGDASVVSGRAYIYLVPLV